MSENIRSEERPSRPMDVRRVNNSKFRRYSKKVCRFCKGQISEISYKDVDKLLRFTTERGKIIPRRLSGNCAKHQRMLAREIKIARVLALLPFVRQ